MTARPQFAGLSATGDRAIAEAAAIHAALSDITNTGGLRADDYPQSIQYAVKAVDTAEAFENAAQVILDAVSDGTATPAQMLLHAFVERVMAEACLLCEMRLGSEQ
jgi:hypothetical protein